MLPHSTSRFPAALLIIVVLMAVPLVVLGARQQPLVYSRWGGPGAAPQPLVGNAQPLSGIAEAVRPGVAALEQYNANSVLQESVADGRVRFFQRSVAGGEITYIVAMLDPQVHVEVVNADGATPGSDATGDTIWTDGQKHLASVREMVQAPYAARDGMTLLGAMAFGFHGDVRTSNEGTVVINGAIKRVNAGRSAVCVTRDGKAQIGLMDAEALKNCGQAVGAGPVILWRGKIVNPDVVQETDEFVPFNPLGEDFVQRGWRVKVFSGDYPKSVIGVGRRADGGAYLVLLNSYGVNGVELARQFKAMGCTEALGGDDDTSTQMVWRGVPVRDGRGREVPDAFAVYVKQ